MSFNAAIKRMSNSSLPAGDRYRGLLEALERSHLPYWEAWADVEQRFGLKIGDPVTHDQFMAVANHLFNERQQWLRQTNELQISAREAKFRRGKRQSL